MVRIKILFILFIISFALNWIWEIIQMPLYSVPWEIWSWECIRICTMSTVWDAGYVVAVFLILAILNKNFGFFRDLDNKDIFIIVFVGVATAMFVEVRALVFGDWAYSNLMPLLPLSAGLSPVVQLPTLSLLSIYLLKKVG